MRVAVMGAGAVGCFFGGMLARAGHSVVLIGRQQHVEAIRHEGLRLEAQSFDEAVKVEASTTPEPVKGAELVLVCVKSTDTQEAASALRAHLAPDALLLSIQNGVDNTACLHAALPQGVIASVVHVAAEMVGPGHIKHRGRGDLEIASSTKSHMIAEYFIAAGVPTRISDNVIGAQWAKLIGNCAYNAISAITHMPYGPISSFAGSRDVIDDLVAECVAVAVAMKISVPGDIQSTVANAARSMPTQLSSTAQDLMRGRRSEIDHLNGYIVRKGEELGIPTPVNRAMHLLVKMLESRPTATYAAANT